MSGQKKRRRAGYGLAAAAIVAAIVVMTVGGFGSDDDDAEATPVKFTPENPAVGSEDNTNPVSPEEFKDWTDVDRFLKQSDTEWYKDCLVRHLEVTREQVGQYANLVEEGHDLRFIVISNSSVSDEEARERLREKGVQGVDQLPITRLSGFTNTEGIPGNRCSPFGDDRNQVRIALGIPVDVDDIDKGMYQKKGVLGFCGNMFLVRPPDKDQPGTTVTTVPRTSTTRPTGTTTTRPSDTTTTTRDSGKDDPGHQAEPPPVTHPVPTTTTTLDGTSSPVGGSGGETTPTTSAPPAEPATTTSRPPGGTEPG